MLVLAPTILVQAAEKPMHAVGLPDIYKYLSPTLVDVPEHVVTEAARRGLRFSINLGMGWPPGRHWLTDEYRSKHLIPSARIDRGPVRLGGDLPIKMPPRSTTRPRPTHQRSRPSEPRSRRHDIHGRRALRTGRCGIDATQSGTVPHLARTSANSRGTFCERRALDVGHSKIDDSVSKARTATVVPDTPASHDTMGLP